MGEETKTVGIAADELYQLQETLGVDTRVTDITLALVNHTLPLISEACNHLNIENVQQQQGHSI